MKKVIFTMAIALAGLTVSSQNLPKPSPSGKSTFVVGATEISLDYSRPSVKGRTIFGDLLPYGELWRLGANASTKFTTTDELTIGGKKLAPGTYALFAIPNENAEWDIIFNTDTKQSGTADYTADKDALRVKAKAESNSFTESMTLTVDKLTNSSASLVLLWDKTRVEVPFEVNTNAVAQKNIDEAIKKGEDLDKVYANAADYYFNSLSDNDKAMTYVEKSLGMKESYRALFLKARILEKKGDKTAAIPLAEKALAQAKADGSTGFADFIASTLEKWNK